jgi:hypothetical protein
MNLKNYQCLSLSGSREQKFLDVFKAVHFAVLSKNGKVIA